MSQGAGEWYGRVRVAQVRPLLVAVSVAAIYAVCLLMAWPAGEFPLNDDWAYAWSVRHLLLTGELRLSDWTSATVVFPVYWGAVFTWLAGEFSFSALRYGTLVVSAMGCLSVYALSSAVQLPPRSAWLATVIVATNPVYLYLSYTFLSDVFYFAPMAFSLSLYVRAVMRRSDSSLWLASMFAALAYLARQLAVTLPIAAALTLLVQDRRMDSRRIVAATAVPVAVFVAHSYWLVYVHGVPWGLELNALRNSADALLRPVLPIELAWRLAMSLLYLGVFSIPALVAVAASVRRDATRFRDLWSAFVYWSLGLLGLVVSIAVAQHRPMPYLANVINFQGFGVIALPGEKVAVTAPWVFWLVTVAAPFAGAAVGALCTDALRNLRRESRGPAGPLLAASALMAVLTASIVFLWDEYLLVFLPAVLYLVLRFQSITVRGLVLGCLVSAGFLFYSTRELADYMDWNQARWAAGRQLVAQGVLPEGVAGGFEWVGWFEFESALPAARAAGRGGEVLGWMGMTPDTYQLAFSPLPGYTVVDAVPYGRARVPDRQIYVLRATAP